MEAKIVAVGYKRYTVVFAGYGKLYFLQAII
jgi:hypothetical protein